MDQSASASCGAGEESSTASSVFRSQPGRFGRSCLSACACAPEAERECARAAETGSEKRAGWSAGFPPFTESSGGSAQHRTCGV
jgi:hypothetical protein